MSFFKGFEKVAKKKTTLKEDAKELGKGAVRLGGSIYGMNLGEEHGRKAARSLKLKGRYKTLVHAGGLVGGLFGGRAVGRALVGDFNKK